MSTVVDNDKYIINGSTLSEIGDAIKRQMPNQYETVTEDAVCYRYTKKAQDSGQTLLNLTEETIQGWYQNTLPSPITKVKIIMTENDGNYSAWTDNYKYFTLNESYTYSLPITIKGTYDSFTFKIYPLNGDNYLFWDSNYYYPSSSSDYNAHLYKEGVSHKRLLPKPKFLVSDIAQKITSLGAGTLEEWYWSTTRNTYLTFPSGFSVKNLKDLTCLSGGSYPRGLYKDSLGKPVSMKDQGIALPSSYSGMNSPVTQAKISAAHNEGRTFCIPWNWTGVKTIPDNSSFIWFVVEPNDSTIYAGSGRYINYTGIGKWTVVYTK